MSQPLCRAIDEQCEQDKAGGENRNEALDSADRARGSR